MLMVNEEPLILTDAEETKWFRFEAAPPATAEGWWDFPVYSSPIAYGKPYKKWDGSENGGGWEGDAAVWKPDASLPPGYENIWTGTGENDASITAVVEQVGAIPKNTRLRFTAYLYSGAWNTDARFIVKENGGDGHRQGVRVHVGPTEGAKRLLSSWQPVSFDVVTKGTSENVEVTFTVDWGKVLILAPRLEVIENEHRPWAYCASAKEGHLSGLFTLPEPLGEIKPNVLFGGGLAPTNPLYGPRPVTYVLYIAGAARTSTMQTIRDFVGFLSEGDIVSNNNGYGWTGRGWLAAPPDVEFISNKTHIARVTFTLTFLEPRIMPTNTFTKNWLGNYFSGETLWDYSSDAIFSTGWKTGAGTVTIKNTTNAPVWPIFSIMCLTPEQRPFTVRVPDVGITMERIIASERSLNVVLDMRDFRAKDTAGRDAYNKWSKREGTRSGPIDMVIKPGKTRTFEVLSEGRWAALVVFGQL